MNTCFGKAARRGPNSSILRAPRGSVLGGRKVLGGRTIPVGHRALVACWALAAIFTVSLLAAPATVQAAVTIQFDDLVVESDPLVPVTGFFDVYFTVTGAPPGVAAYNLQLGVTPASSGLSLTGAVQAPGPTHPALFPGQTPLVFGTGNVLQVADNLPPGPDATLTNGIGLVRVNFSVAPATWGVFNLAFDPLFTLLFDGNGDPVTIDTYNTGTITVVPEPASLAIWTGLLAGAAMHARRRVRRRERSAATVA